MHISTPTGGCGTLRSPLYTLRIPARGGYVCKVFKKRINNYREKKTFLGKLGGGRGILKGQFFCKQILKAGQMDSSLKGQYVVKARARRRIKTTHNFRL
jgi:hypothetical protein